MAQPAAQFCAAGCISDCFVICLFSLVCVFSSGLKTASLVRREGFYPFVFRCFPEKKRAKCGKGIHFDENLNIFSIFIEIKRSIHAPVGGAGNIGIVVLQQARRGRLTRRRRRFAERRKLWGRKFGERTFKSEKIRNGRRLVERSKGAGRKKLEAENGSGRNKV